MEPKNFKKNKMSKINNQLTTNKAIFNKKMEIRKIKIRAKH